MNIQVAILENRRLIEQLAQRGTLANDLAQRIGDGAHHSASDRGP